jgi:MscS family membrane protein
MDRPSVERFLPAPLLGQGPQGLLWWQWVALPVLVLLALAAGWLLGRLTARVLHRLAARTRSSWDEILVQRIAAPLTLLWSVGVATALLPSLGLPAGATGWAGHLLRALTYLSFFWALYRSIHVAFGALADSPWAREHGQLAGQLPMGRKLAKLTLLAIGAVAVLNQLGFQVASLLAGLGIGGLALALGAQKAFENLFGTVALGADQPFRLGDFVKVEDFVGTVEQIGMRSTRFRTLDRTLITIPNGRLADMRLETFAARDRIRLFANLGLVYSTSNAQMREVIAGIRGVLEQHPKIWPDAIAVRFSGFGDSSLNLEVMAWFQTSDFDEFCDIRTEVFLRFMEVVERAGSSFAFPTRTVHIAAGPAGGSGGR